MTTSNSTEWRPSARHGPVMSARVARDPAEALKDRKARFDALNKFITARAAWITSIPGARTVVVEAVSAAIASDLEGLGYEPVEIEPGQRIISGAIEERFIRTASGELAPWSEGSDHPVAEVRRHAGICPTRRYCFTIT